MKRKCVIIANWKLNKNKETIKNFFQILKNKNILNININCHIAIAAPTIYLDLIAQYTNNYPNITTAAQNIDIHLLGPFTGETSVLMLKDIGVQYVIIGHSERKIHHKENNTEIIKKFDITKQTGLIPILCIGENQEEKYNGKTKLICEQQLKIIFQSFGSQAFKNTIIAYEPTWAIGKGIIETPENIQIIHKFIREYISSYDHTIAQQTTIQYGGSVNQNNIKKLLTQPDIDGVLIGTSSLEANTFALIIKYAESIKNKTL